MPTGQQYATNVPQTYLTGQINPTATVMSVNSSSGWPSVFPFTAVLEIGTGLQEPIDVTNISGTTWTIVRAIDNTVAFTHNPNATVTHADIGRDFREARAHIDASASNDATGHSVHGLGVGSAVVGTTDNQTLSGKTISAGTYTGAQAMGSGAWSGTGSLTETTVSVTGLAGASNGTTRLAGQIGFAGGGPPTGGTFAVGDIVEDLPNGALWMCTTAGTPGIWAFLGGSKFGGAVANGTSNVTFNIGTTNFTSQFTDLTIEYEAHSSNALGGGVDTFTMQINGVVTGYNYSYIQSNVGSATVSTASNSGQTSSNVGLLWSSAGAAGGAGRGFIKFPAFNSTLYNKQWVWQTAATDGGTTGYYQSGMGGVLGSTGAISSLTFLTSAGNFTNTTFRIYLS